MTPEAEWTRIPAPIPAEAAEAFAADARRLAEEIGLEGILEVQAVFHGGKCKIIEMNGHLPELSALCLAVRGADGEFAADMLALAKDMVEKMDGAQ